MGIVISIISFCVMGFVLGSLGAHVDSWQYWVMVLVMFIYGLFNRLAD